MAPWVKSNHLVCDLQDPGLELRHSKTNYSVMEGNEVCVSRLSVALIMEETLLLAHDFINGCLTPSLWVLR